MDNESHCPRPHSPPQIQESVVLDHVVSIGSSGLSFSRMPRLYYRIGEKPPAGYKLVPAPVDSLSVREEESEPIKYIIGKTMVTKGQEEPVRVCPRNAIPPRGYFKERLTHGQRRNPASERLFIAVPILN